MRTDSRARVESCCEKYGFSKGYRYRDEDYRDAQSEEELRRYNEPRPRHRHNPLSVARGTIIGYREGRKGNSPEKVPRDLIRTCCASFGFWDGLRAGQDHFFETASEDEKARYLLAARIERNEKGWG
ncbi:hypothetical protein [Streptomyces albipurpureus]|uniref:Uncharacterized protein n=1 Tax=Streptomyces albipurpureus TaxID=2897419 RepID=A0ABT0UHI5_9ACTN|nr:hypothetical protein [Streptomyces sp. CWNU-1]MCM2388117.1 hypothetical protein [Streptomyces sp. CWNU-1]